MRYAKVLFFSIAVVFISFAATPRAHADTLLFKTIVPADGVCHCDNQQIVGGTGTVNSAPSWGCVLQVLQNVIYDAVSLGIILCVLWIAYAGISLITSAGKSESISQSKARIANAVIGIVVILCAWLVVDFVMKVLYEPTAAFDGGTFGPWNNILASNGNDYCIVPRVPEGLIKGTLTILGSVTTGTSDTGSTNAVVGPASGDCSEDAIGKDWNSAQKGKLFSCIINNESKCQNIATQAASTVAGVGSSAGGRYQVVMSTNGLNFPACVAIARANGYTESTFNCGTHYPKGHSDSSSAAAACRKAQLDPTCNTQAAQYLYAHGGVSHWLGSGDIGGKNKACVTMYGG